MTNFDFDFPELRKSRHLWLLRPGTRLHETLPNYQINALITWIYLFILKK